MNEQEIIDGNKLIAGFMGYSEVVIIPIGGWDVEGFKTPCPDKEVKRVSMPDNDHDWHDVNNLKYDSSWDWLMPVVIKINTLGNFEYNVEIKTMDVSVWLDEAGKMTQVAESSFDNNPSELIKSVYECVINFIKWYNERIQN